MTEITSIAELEALYAPINPTAILKEIDHVNAEYAKFIEAAPFVILSTVGPEGLDCSPRGDPAGFVRVADPKTLLIPDRKGNNRVDSLRNIVRDPRIALLFIIPGIGNTMRVNGRAALVTDSDGRLAGIFTHGDFARRFPSDPAIGTRPVGEVMTVNPVTIGADKLAAEVLLVLEPHRIDDLVVTDADGKPLGAVDSQDLSRLKLI
jgi:predicted pyridoxine 5'-phosphate oxidase superfamily flavin-nucleotide-binding protein